MGAPDAREPSLETKRARANQREGCPLQVLVRDNNVDQALRVLKKKMQREGVFREMKQRRSYEKPSERKVREKSEAIRRARKLARKKAQREGLIPDTRKKKIDDKRNGGRPGMGGRTSGGFGGGGGMGGGGGFGGGGDRSGPPRF
jgi:small subunit ribosomal protein S21